MRGFRSYGHFETKWHYNGTLKHVSFTYYTSEYVCCLLSLLTVSRR